MRKCNSCGALLPDDSRFCSECGSSDIVSIPEEPVAQQPAPAPQPAPSYPQPDPQPAPQQPSYPAGGYAQPAAPANNGQQGYYQQAAPQSGYNAPSGGSHPAGNAVPPAGGYQQPGAYPYAAAQPNAAPVKKKKHTGLIIVIVLGVLFIIGAVILFVGARIAKKALENMDPNAYIDELISEFEDGLIVDTTPAADDTTPAVAYTKGELVGDVYTNEWAGIRFTLPENFVNGSAEDYDDSSDPYTDACLVAEYDNNGISFLIEEPDGYSGMGVEDYLKYLTEDALDEDMTSQGWSFGDIYSMTIAGESYRAIKMSNSQTDVFEEIIACRIYNDRMLCFICYGDTAVIDAFFAGVTTP
ncbi:MAG: zinc-ribbon domain-containing protein [Clostridia bacterium]|nr:zinc-ribbon domain-containing protein [Clostridia bacterium]